MYARYLNEVELALTTLQPPEKPSIWLAENYIGGGASALRYLNLKIPDVRRTYKAGFSFSALDAKTQWKIWDYVWKNSNIFEVMLFSSYWAASRPIEELIAHKKLLLSWLNRVDNWAHSDELSAHYSKLLEYDLASFLPVFKKWNESRKPWLKRQSMVGLLFYSRFRKKYPPLKTILGFVDRHIEDDHYYVQKAVGWTLREAWNVYPTETFQYLKKNAHRIPSGGWTAATEKLPKTDKQALMKIRKSKR